jgi:exosortase
MLHETPILTISARGEPRERAETGAPPHRQSKEAFAASRPAEDDGAMIPDPSRSAIRPNAVALAIAAATVVLPPGWNLFRYWIENPLYHYGLAVPFLAAILIWKALRSGGATDAAARFSPSSPPATWIVLIGYALFVPIARTVQIANPDWRLADGCLASFAVAALLALARATGGPVLFRLFLLPSLFLLTAVPWPQRMENAITDTAARVLVDGAALVLDRCGITAIESGRTLITPVGSVAVADDCGGIRSIQVGIMTAIFWTIYFRLSAWGILGLMAGSALMAILFNTARVAGVVLAAVWLDQPGLISGFHDVAGTVIQGLFILGISWLAQRLASKSHPAPARDDRSLSARCHPVFACLCILWAGLAELGANAWFRSREIPEQQAEALPDLRANPDIPGATSEPMPDELRRNFRFSEAKCLRWRDADNVEWNLYWLRVAGENLSDCTHHLHKPEICLPMADFSKIADFPTLPCRVGARTVPFDHSLFRRGQRTFHLFHAKSYHSQSSDHFIQSDPTYRGRLLAALNRIRSGGVDLIHLTSARDAAADHTRQLALDYLGKILGEPDGSARSSLPKKRHTPSNASNAAASPVPGSGTNVR